MKVLRSDVVALAEALGYATASGWKKPAMLKKLKDLSEIDESEVKDDVDGDVKLMDVFRKIKAAGGDVDVVQTEDELGTEPEVKAPAEEPDEKDDAGEVEEDAEEEVNDEEAEDEEDEDEDEYEPIKPKKEKKVKKAKAEKPVKKAKAPKAEKPVKKANAPKAEKVKVDKGITRSTAAGMVLKKFGRSSKITEEMVVAVNKLCENDNDVQSRWHLSAGKNVLAAFLAK